MKKSSYIIIALLVGGLICVAAAGWYSVKENSGRHDSFFALLSTKSATKTLPAFSHLVVTSDFPANINALFVRYDLSNANLHVGYSNKTPSQLVLPTDMMATSTFTVRGDTLFLVLRMPKSAFQGSSKDTNSKSTCDIRTPEWRLNVAQPLLSVDFRAINGICFDNIRQDSLGISSLSDIAFVGSTVNKIGLEVSPQNGELTIKNSSIGSLYLDSECAESMNIDEGSKVNDFYIRKTSDDYAFKFGSKPCNVHWMPAAMK